MIITNDELEDIIWNEYLKNKQTQRVLKKPTKEFEKTNKSLLLFQGLIYVSEHQQKDIIWMYYDELLREHCEIHKMIEVISQSYYFSHMQEKMKKYVNKCDLCHKIKSSRHKSYREMRQTLTLDWLWAFIVMDFIVKLSLSKKLLTEVFYDLILTIVNQLMKEVWFIPYKKASNTEELAYMFLWNVTALQGLPDKIISDRDKLFTSNFWTALTRQLRLSHKMSTVYHSQTDDQTEWMNQVIEQYLREYVNYHQMNWVALLSVTQIAYNTSVNQITDIISFFVNHEYNANLFQESKKAMVLTEQVNVTVTEMQMLHKELKQDIEFLLHRSAFYHNKHRSGGPMLKKRDRVYLLWKNIEMTRSSNKLDHVKIRPFKIIRNIKEVSFKLELLKEMQWKHLVFHILLLEPASDAVSVLE